MNTCYFEVRHKIDIRHHAQLAADIAQYLQARQHLGKTVVICERPINTLAVVRKLWLKLARNLQKERASTINAEKILRLTKSITHMHHMVFTSKTPEQNPSAHVFFIEPEQALMLPLNTYTIYVTCLLQKSEADRLIEQLPTDALVVDYANTIDTTILRPKQELRERAEEEWKHVISLLEMHGIDVQKLIALPQPPHILDDALDILLGINHRFLQTASAFHHAFELAQPTRLTIHEQRRYDILALLAHRVYALTPQFGQQPNYNISDDTFFLHDSSIEAMDFARTPTQVIREHHYAGRERLARALTFVRH